MPFLFWKLIEESKTEGAEQLDFSPTDLDNEGLIGFKDQFGTARTQITYLRYSQATKEASEIPSRIPCAGQRSSSALPGVICWRLGRMLYRHMG